MPKFEVYCEPFEAEDLTDAYQKLLEQFKFQIGLKRIQAKEHGMIAGITQRQPTKSLPDDFWKKWKK